MQYWVNIIIVLYPTLPLSSSTLFQLREEELSKSTGEQVRKVQEDGNALARALAKLKEELQVVVVVMLVVELVCGVVAIVFHLSTSPFVTFPL